LLRKASRTYRANVPESKHANRTSHDSFGNERWYPQICNGCPLRYGRDCALCLKGKHTSYTPAYPSTASPEKLPKLLKVDDQLTSFRLKPGRNSCKISSVPALLPNRYGELETANPASGLPPNFNGACGALGSLPAGHGATLGRFAVQGWASVGIRTTPRAAQPPREIFFRPGSGSAISCTPS